MKRAAFIAIVSLVICGGYWLRHAPADVEPSDRTPAVYHDLHTGDVITLHLDQRSNNERMTIGGKLVSFDGNTFELAADVTPAEPELATGNMKPGHVVHRDYWVSRNNVAFISKETPAPASQP